MMKHYIISILLICICLTTHAERRALVIGIGNYPAAGGWTKINGDKDIPLVEEMLTANGFSRHNIIELKNEQATCAAICRELEHLISSSKAGDIIYIHFSGHGQQITDLNGDEEEGLDEAWIPYDAQFALKEGQYEGENHLVDDQINNYLHRLRISVGNEGKIIVVADACHSGDGTRAEEDNVPGEIIRGTHTVFTIANIKKTIQRFISTNKKKVSQNINNAHISPYTPTPIEWIYISACKANQSNTEYAGKGSLTFAIYSFMYELNRKSLIQISKAIEEFYQDPNKFEHTQTPQFEYPTGSEKDLFL